MFKLEFDTTGPLFAAGMDAECRRVLGRIQAELFTGKVSGDCFDSGGKPIGFWELLADQG